MRSAVTLWLVCAGLVVGALVLVATNDEQLAINVGQALVILALLGFATVGVVILRRHRNHPMGWVFVGGATVGVLEFTAGEWAVRERTSDTPSGLARIAGWLENWIQFPGVFALLVLTLFLFPDGRFVSPRWRRTVICAGAVTLSLTVAVALAPGPFPHPLERWDNPFGVGGGAGSLLRGAAAWAPPVTAAALACGVAALVVRYRRSDPSPRMQIKWLVYAFALSVAVFVWFTAVPHPGRTTEGLQAVVFGLAVLAIPIAAGVAILRHHLYDIDVLISKTLVYGGLVAFVTGVYVLVVTVIGTAIGSRHDLALSVLATTIAAAAFHPLHVRLTRVANRLVFGDRARPIELLTELSRTMAGTPELDDILSSTARIVATGVGAARGLVWVRRGNTLVPAGHWPPAAPSPPDAPPVIGETLEQIVGEDGVWPVHHHQHLIGAISVVMSAGVELSSLQHRQLGQLAWAAGLVLENVRLVDELRASRTRIVVAQDAERKRIERDLHDGAQQRLLNASLAIGVARTEAAGMEAPRLQDALDQASSQAHEALDELRRLARGIHPAILTDRGLVPAVRSLLEHAPLPVVLAASPDLGTRRLPPAVEAAAYFVVAEAVANCLKHAAPSTIDVELTQPDGALLVRVCDDGAGGAAWLTGGGLQGLGDRVAVLGGRLELDSQAHHGTRVTAVLPCA